MEFSSQLIETLQTSMGVFVCMGPSGTAGVFLLRGGLVLDHRSVNRVVLHPVVSSMMSQNVRHVFTVTRQFKKKKNKVKKRGLPSHQKLRQNISKKKKREKFAVEQLMRLHT